MTSPSRGMLPKPVYMGLARSLGGEPSEADFVHAVEHGDETSFIIVKKESAWLVRFEGPSTTEVLFLSDLRGGRYSERVVLDDKGGGEIEAVYKHRRLGRDKTLLARIPTLPPGTLGAHTTSDTDYAIERGEQLRQTLKRWAGVAEESPTS